MAPISQLMQCVNEESEALRIHFPQAVRRESQDQNPVCPTTSTMGDIFKHRFRKTTTNRFII